jgi:NAD(P)-dependent dehydrogenase (short-subunit alcohol dehydrogenase family)
MAIWLITGCSTGLGRALAARVLDDGHHAVVTARKDSAIQDLIDAHPDTALGLALDVTDPVQVAGAVRRTEERFGRIDVLVNNAGYGYRASVEEGGDADVRQLFDTNLFGAIAMIKAVLPGMRARRSGTIVNISSIGACARRSSRSASPRSPSNRAPSARTSPVVRSPSPPRRSPTTPRPRESAARRTTRSTGLSRATRRVPPQP